MHKLNFTTGLLIFLLSFIFIPAKPQDVQNTESVDTILVSKPKDDTGSISPKLPVLSLEANIQRTQEFTFEIGRINHILQNELDTGSINSIMPSTERFINAVEFRLEHPKSKINLRYMNALINWHRSTANLINEAQGIINARIMELAIVKQNLDSIRQDQILNRHLRDTTLLPEYQQTISTLSINLEKSDSILNAQRLTVAKYQSMVSNLTIRIKGIGERLRVDKRNLEKALLSKETNFIWEPKEYPDPERLIDVFRDSLWFNFIFLKEYLNTQLGLTLFLIFIVILIYRWILRNLNKIKREKEFATIILSRVLYIQKYPLLSSCFFVLAIAPIFYPSPPVSFFALALLILISISGILLSLRIGKRGMKLWMMMFGLGFISTASNLYLETSFHERWHLLFFSLIGILLGFKLIKLQKQEPESIPSYAPTIVKIYIAFCAASILANILGRFSLGKILGITATVSLLHAISLIVFIVIIKELIYLQIERSRKDESEITSVVNYYDIKKKINSMFVFLAVGIWVYHFFGSLTLLKSVLEWIGDFLTQPRSILNATFTFSQIAVFILVIYMATFLANTLAYIANVKDQQKVSTRNKRLGSSILLIRLAVLSIGFLIAIAASGIPLDKITIVLGALSVGIGFGLQTVVNNLVSGVILAFERPIQIGDAIQVGPVEGIVREIGIRASKIKNWDGAEIIIPNGDLLAQHLTNWTLSDKQRRVELIIGVSYKADMDKVTELIQEQLNREEILKNPNPRVFMQAFGDNSLNFRILFWVNDFDVWVNIRDQVMRGIWKAFQEFGVEIPLPQRDLHVKSFPGLIKETIFEQD